MLEPVDVLQQINAIYQAEWDFPLTSALSGGTGVRIPFGSMAVKPQSQNHELYTHHLT